MIKSLLFSDWSTSYYGIDFPIDTSLHVLIKYVWFEFERCSTPSTFGSQRGLGRAWPSEQAVLRLPCAYNLNHVPKTVNILIIAYIYTHSYINFNFLFFKQAPHIIIIMIMHTLYAYRKCFVLCLWIPCLPILAGNNLYVYTFYTNLFSWIKLFFSSHNRIQY